MIRKTIKVILGIIILLILLGCENESRKYHRDALIAFTEDIIPDINKNWKIYITSLLSSEKEHEKATEKLIQKLLKEVNPYHSTEQLKEESFKWEFWEEVIKNPEKYVCRINQDSAVVLEHKTSTYGEDCLYYSGLVSLLFIKDDLFAHFRIFFIHSPEKFGWEPVHYEFGWPSPLPKKYKK